MGSEMNKDSSCSMELDALILGAGWAGLWSLYQLKQLGLKVKLVEANSEVGGVWNYSLYPGCRNDTEVPLYEYSEPKLWQNWNWTERFPAQQEIQRYLIWVSRQLDLRSHMIFDTRIESALWDEEQQCWQIYDKGHQLCTTKFFLPCTGYTTIKQVPSFPGAQTFKNAYHTSQWPTSLDYAGKRVGVIGVAASGIQVIQAVHSKVKHLTVFQRTPNLATPMVQESYNQTSIDELKRGFPQRFANRISRNGYDIKPRDRCTLDDKPIERREFYESLWAYGGLSFWFSNYKDMLYSPAANMEAYNFWRSKTTKRIINPDVADILAPRKPAHPFGTKRPSLESGYFEVFNQPNVTLVDVKRNPIDEITSKGIITADGTLHELDILVYATGFDFLVGSILAMNIQGVGGAQLKNKWDVSKRGKGVWTHLGLMTAGFPNMFFPMGPQAPSALGLTPQMAEAQGNWIAGLISHMMQMGKRVVEPTLTAEKLWKSEVIRAAKETLMGQIDSWYVGANISGRKKEPLCYFGGVDKYLETLNTCTRGLYSDFVMQ